ncbi:unnamed protein product [Sphagnum jensenii]|uniref:Uncharacterized protein n=1 Tax=Sphagnum jensenii TaxID=128206 RepID=A0ABP1BXA7_9BRYO
MQLDLDSSGYHACSTVGAGNMLAEKTTSVSSQKKLKPLLSYMYERAGIHDFSAGICAVSGDYCMYARHLTDLLTCVVACLLQGPIFLSTCS